MEYRTLGKTGMKVSKLSFGASSLGSVFRKVDEDVAVQTTHLALDLGINYIDTAPYYGLTLSEKILGKALKDVPRDQYFLATKCGRYGDDPKDFDFTYDRIIKSAHESMERIGVDYLDVLQLHDIEYCGRPTIEQALEEGIPALQKLKEDGVIRFYGLAIYPIEVFLEAAQRVEYDTILCHNHYHLINTRMLELLPLEEERGMALISASPLASRLLTSANVPDWHPATPEQRALVRKAVDLCAEEGTTIEQLAIQFATANDKIPTTLVSTGSPERLKKNVEWLDGALDMGLVEKVRDILEPMIDVDVAMDAQ